MRIFKLGNPWALIFFIFPIACIVILSVSKFFIKKGVKLSGVSFFEKGFSFLTTGYYFSIFLIITGMFIIALSLSKPMSGVKKEKVISKGIDILITLDTSNSMLAEDFLKQTRIDGAKNILYKFVDKRKGDRIGLVTFGQSAFLRCPATVNFELLKKIIKSIYIDKNSYMSSQTAIGVGLASSINRLVKIKDDKDFSKIIILLTDGINNAGEISPETAAEIAMSKNIKIYSIGIGAKTDIDANLLTLISDKTGGVFFHSKTSGELGQIFQEIDKLEKHEVETYEFTRFKNLGYKIAYFGIIILFIGLFFNIIIFKRIN